MNTSNNNSEALKQESWYEFLSDKQKSLADLSIILYDRERLQATEFEDYSFIVFPMAKVYEGFLKKYFLEMKLIDLQEYTDKRFRIGRALNPDVITRQQDERWLYDDVARVCGNEVARNLWNTWLESRNRIFHYFPDTALTLTLEQAGGHLDQITFAMRDAMECEWHI